MTLQHTSGFLPVLTAVGGNAVVTVSKFGAALVSGSSSMFSETVHSFADTLNQMLLLIGLRRSLKKADESFEYGYGRERFFWALISACGVFFVGAGVTAYKGIASLVFPEPIEISPLIFGVLLFSLVVESYTFYVAARTLRKSFPEATWLERFRAADPMTLAVCLEDAVAVAGVCIAAFAIGISYYTGSAVWDALGSIVISVFLAATAITLIVKNRAYLIGKAMPEKLQEEVVKLLEADPAIEKVIDFKSAVLGWGVYRIKCEVEFNGGALLREAYRKRSMKDQFENVRGDFEEFKRFLADYTDRIPRLMGKKIDEIEKRLCEKHPSIRHIDIEIN
ncbi:MAG: Cation efflux protein [Candidatus Kaiserbacteria bacterium GW2011_GWC2_52_8b]|uniref:Cation efflux protein n=2 Tax=Candidatus Kaiseribacteriota TaxID=1752734 RepID=A0A0G1ZSU0_9BACT|nr:MAG: Cation efflux protein [Candidatus Kaiserbacteria bacterium GW2011_GWA2_52_12]KKW31382.1 MAG: Cation efflux protein [Candidatus Kaiserbacteria bacterium GW2011_GWC2_52_8b]